MKVPIIAVDGRYVQEHFPGIGRYVGNLLYALAGLAEPDFKLKIIYNPDLVDHRHNLPALAAEYPDKVELLYTKATPFSAAEQWQLFSLARKVAVWHAPYYLRPYLLPVRSVLTAYDVTSARLPELMPSRKAKTIFEATTRMAFAVSKRIIVPSELIKRDIIELYKVNPAKIRVILTGVEPKFAPVSPEQTQIWREELKLPASYLLYVGINKPHKNLVRLFEAFAIFKKRTASPSVLLIAGKEDERYQANLRRQVSALNLNETVRFWGEVAEADLPKLYNCADLFVSPSLYEGIGLPAMEALACGIPVACAGNSAMPEMMGNAALTFSPYDVLAMANTLEQIMLNPALRQELHQKALIRAKSFDWQQTAARHLQVYQELLR
jgi:glycosyltransferase involved in cell wall biosynthesis